MKTARTVFLVLGIVFLGLALLGLAGAIVSAIAGVSAYEDGNHNSAGLAKLACVICLVVGIPLLILGTAFLIPGVVLHIIIRRRAKRESNHGVTS